MSLDTGKQAHTQGISAISEYLQTLESAETGRDDGQLVAPSVQHPATATLTTMLSILMTSATTAIPYLNTTHAERGCLHVLEEEGRLRASIPNPNPN